MSVEQIDNPDGIVDARNDDSACYLFFMVVFFF